MEQDTFEKRLGREILLRQVELKRDIEAIEACNETLWQRYKFNLWYYLWCRPVEKLTGKSDWDGDWWPK